MRGTRECHFSLTVCGKVAMYYGRFHIFKNYFSEGGLLPLSEVPNGAYITTGILDSSIGVLVRLALLQVLSQCLPVILYAYSKASEH